MQLAIKRPHSLQSCCSSSGLKRTLRGEMSSGAETYAKAETFTVLAFYLQGFLLSEKLPDV